MRGFVPRTGFRFDVRATGQNMDNRAPISARLTLRASPRTTSFRFLSLSLLVLRSFFLPLSRRPSSDPNRARVHMQWYLFELVDTTEYTQ